MTNRYRWSIERGAILGAATLGALALAGTVVAADASVSSSPRVPPAEADVGSATRATLPTFEVVLTGRVFGWGKDTPFPKKRTPGIVFGESFAFGKTREDGYLDLARSKDGRRLFARVGYDNGDVQTATFEVKSADALPDGAILQFVDGRVTAAPSSGPPGVFKWKDKLFQQHFEAWLALPKEHVIVRPSDQQRIPLLPVAGKYVAAKAARAQWVVYVPKCSASENGCVYYGPPGATCGRYVRESETQGQGLVGYPGDCDVK
ncbi:MAG TPA: hypothetical protein VGG33_15700 [Polyangia bacterium]